tara:strand:- start:606 stop:1175 length:570 start_codon:yes stop_codon:yes gene_type:complete
MEPITTAIAAVTAASNAIGFIKARINDVQSVADISDQIGTLFSAQKKLNEERNKQAGVGDINIRSSIDAVLEAKKLNEQMQEIATMINLRWPKPADQPSTWQEILNHHNQKLREQKEAIKKAQVQEALRQQEMAETIKTCAIIFGVLLVAIFLFAVMFMTIARSVEGERYDYSRTVFSLENTASLHDVG